MRFLVLCTAFLSVSPISNAQDVIKIGRMWLEGLAFGADTAGGSDCWGYTAPDGTEYALVGTPTGIAVVKAATMELIETVPAATGGDFPYKHRDMKTYRHYAYAVGEMTGTLAGLTIMDMQYLPDSVRYVGTFKTLSDATSHNFSIDTATAHAYILKSNYSGFRIVSIQDPENPVEIATVSTPNIHDVYARNDTVWVAEGWSPTFSLYDVTDKHNPALILRHTVPTGGYVHNIWPTDDGRYAITTEETDFRTVKIWDVSDPGNVTLTGEYLAPCNLAHNVHVKGDRLYISHYESGVTVVDISDPSAPVELARYDTFPRGENANFRGCWGAYPFTQNGYFYASDIEGYLTVLSMDTMATSVDDELSVPLAFGLDQNYPNPFNPRTEIGFHLPAGQAGNADFGRVSLRIFDMLGQEVAVLVNEYLAPGRHVRTWDATNSPSGVYLYRLQAGGVTETRKMVLMR
jgi:choice-of-anchor B domain-containing protein